MNTPQISITSLSPFYDPLTAVFRQGFTFKSPFPIDQERMSKIIQAASEMFSDAMLSNNLDDFAWPPDQAACKAAKDFKSGMIEFTTRACRARPIILDA